MGRNKQKLHETPVAEARELLRLVEQSSIVELEACWNGSKITVRKEEPQMDVAPVAPNGLNAAAGLEIEPEPLLVSAPAVGRFWRGAGPGSEALVERGQRVRTGQQVASIESLTTPIKVVTAQEGDIEEILAEDGQAVGYGDPLFVIRRVDA